MLSYESKIVHILVSPAGSGKTAVTKTIVKLDGKKIGMISEVHGGYRYTPDGPASSGKDWSGEVFSTVAAVKLSLE